MIKKTARSRKLEFFKKYFPIRIGKSFDDPEKNRKRKLRHPILKLFRDIGEHPRPGTRCWTAGWGYTDKGKVADQLQEVDLKELVRIKKQKSLILTKNGFILTLKKIISDRECKTTENSAFLVSGAMFCAGL